MALTVVGSVALDSITTPFGSAERVLGGSAVHAAVAASFFTDVRIVGPVGEDFESHHYEFLEGCGVDTSEMPLIRGGKTFSWSGHYGFDLSVAHTDETHLNVFEGWRPGLAPASRDADMLFLAAMDPDTQADVREQWQGGKWCALDSMGYWIKHKPEALAEGIRSVDFVLMNDQEARALTRERMLLRAAREIMSWGPKAVVLKLGEYGCALLHEGGYFSLPGYPLEDVVDPTGAGDAFAGGFLGYLDLVPGARMPAEALRRAVTYGCVMASYCVEDFGAQRLARLTEREVNYRFADFLAMTHFEHVPTHQRPHDKAAAEAAPTRLERPHATPTTIGYDQPKPTAGTPSYDSPRRTPSTEPLHPPQRPLPPPTES